MNINLSEIKKILKNYNLHLSKKLGQHLLIDNHILEKIMKAGEIGAGDRVVEVGPGLGALTRSLLQRGAEVWAIEKDKGFCRVLEDILPQENLYLYHEDALQADWPSLLPSEKKPYKFVANLPYNITSPLLFSFLRNRSLFSFFLIMVQKEVGNRIAAKPGSKDYGALTLKLNYFLTSEVLFKVPPGAFFPAPDVDSIVIMLKPREEAPFEVWDQELFLKLINCGFTSRRKLLSNNLKLLDYTGEEIKAALKSCSLAEQVRAEELSLQNFACLANFLARDERR